MPVRQCQPAARPATEPKQSKHYPAVHSDTPAAAVPAPAAKHVPAVYELRAATRELLTRSASVIAMVATISITIPVAAAPNARATLLQSEARVACYQGAVGLRHHVHRRAGRGLVAVPTERCPH